LHGKPQTNKGKSQENVPDHRVIFQFNPHLYC
jgi:hypothetical protein